MKIVKTASGKNRIKMSKSEWTSIGKKAGWMKKANDPSVGQMRSLPKEDPSYQRVLKHHQELKHALKTQNDPAARQAKANLQQMKSFLEQNGVNWKSDPYLLEALSDI